MLLYAFILHTFINSNVLYYYCCYENCSTVCVINTMANIHIACAHYKKNLKYLSDWTKEKVKQNWLLNLVLGKPQSVTTKKWEKIEVLELDYWKDWKNGTIPQSVHMAQLTRWLSWGLLRKDKKEFLLAAHWSKKRHCTSTKLWIAIPHLLLAMTG